ncbi:MAG: hypothetical protein H8E44_17760 [Planctomycetes bacterium]|nr:hypothetical protein [Planctomycetota bacterium]MBL7038508.1 hypothetical protein [Pirellulaceae bacterium]
MKNMLYLMLFAVVPIMHPAASATAQVRIRFEVRYKVQGKRCDTGRWVTLGTFRTNASAQDYLRWLAIHSTGYRQWRILRLHVPVSTRITPNPRPAAGSQQPWNQYWKKADSSPAKNRRLHATEQKRGIG